MPPRGGAWGLSLRARRLPNLLLSSTVLSENEGTVATLNQTGIVTLLRNEIVSRRDSSLSIVAEGPLAALKEQEIVHPIPYLQSPAPVPPPKD